MIRFVGSGCMPTRNNLLASTASTVNATKPRLLPRPQPRAQPAKDSGRYINDTVPRLKSATASVV